MTDDASIPGADGIDVERVDVDDRPRSRDDDPPPEDQTDDDPEPLAYRLERLRLLRTVITLAVVIARLIRSL
ncbi:hypothetical protein [Halorubrum sp. N11]|uniref:hypothetical protein n=1 Tax=Halorubrum sp. N11 TaxID=3402276 RepID=UPI003EC0E805